MSIRFPRAAQHRLFSSLSLLLLLVLPLAACRQVTPSPGPVQETIPPATEKPLPSVTRTAQAPTTAQSPTQTPQPASRLGLEPSDLQDTAVVFWHVWNGEAGETLDRLVEEFNNGNEWGVTVESAYQGNYDELSQKVNTALAESALPDLVLSYGYQAQGWGGEGGQGKNETLVDLNDYVNDPVWGLPEEEQKDFYPAFWEGEVVGGKRLGIPAQRSAQVLYYNATWAQELGFPSPPTTPAEFERQACAAAEANRLDDNPDNDGSGGWIISTHYASVSSWIYAFGGTVAEPDGGGYGLELPETEQALAFLRGLYDQGCAWLVEIEPGEPEFANRMGLFASGSAAGIRHQATVFERAGSADEWTALPYPSPDGEPAITVYGPSFHILKSQPQRQLAAWLFIKWLASPGNQAQLSRSSEYFPVRQSAVELLSAEGGGVAASQWAAALGLLQYARPEPPMQSWNTVRWALSDAATQLFRYYFTLDQVPELVELLDETADDLHRVDR